MSPRISERLSRWYLPRYSARGVYERMAKHRVDFLTDGVWQSLSADAPFCLRNHRVAISYSTPESSNDIAGPSAAFGIEHHGCEGGENIADAVAGVRWTAGRRRGGRRLHGWHELGKA